MPRAKKVSKSDETHKAKLARKAASREKAQRKAATKAERDRLISIINKGAMEARMEVDRKWRAGELQLPEQVAQKKGRRANR